jgi:putative hydrolase of the HAD superfamily
MACQGRASDAGCKHTDRMTSAKRRAVIFDLDDTLVDTSHVYWLSRSAFLDTMVAAGFERSEVLGRFEEIDSRHILQQGYVPERYERSMLATYVELCSVENARPAPEVIAQIAVAGGIVRDVVPEIIPGAVELVEGARALGYISVLLTRGIDVVQQRKLDTHALRHHFEFVEIVSKKDGDTIAGVIAKIGIQAEDCWVVGDSIKSDVNPAIQAGANAILYLYTHHSYYWRQEYGVRPLGTFYLARDLSEALQILASPAEAQRVSSLPERDPQLPS